MAVHTNALGSVFQVASHGEMARSNSATLRKVPRRIIRRPVQLPGVTGYDAARQLKATAATTSIPVVGLTASAMRGEDRKAQEAGCDGILTKPLAPRMLRETLRRFLPRDFGR